ncbi:xaa-Pro dipeptidase-like [Tigriopus californicus]|nr:xaa-Pro dipeptidase-like [Tigriopus californicus]
MPAGFQASSLFLPVLDMRVSALLSGRQAAFAWRGRRVLRGLDPGPSLSVSLSSSSISQRSQVYRSQVLLSSPWATQFRLKSPREISSESIRPLTLHSRLVPSRNSSNASPLFKMAEPNPKDGYFSMGPNTLKVPMALFARNRQRLAEALRSHAKTPDNSVVLLQGGGDQGICEGDSSDVGPIFKQEAYFHWAFGVLEPDHFGAVDVTTGKGVLYIPRLPKEYATWMGSIKNLEETKERYRVDEVRYVDDMPNSLRELQKEPTLLTLNGVNSDSKKQTRPAAFDGMSEFKIEPNHLQPIMAECRVIKTEMELQALRYASKISSEAHKSLMRQIKPGMKEFQCESLFLHHIYFYGGARHVCYNCIVGSGQSGSVLHYGHAGAPNDQNVEDGHIVLFDMGAEYYRFCSDITCSYPVNGKFTDKQKVVYNAVLRASRAVLNAVKPGVNYKDMHLLANRVMLENLLEGGIIQGDIEDMMKVNLAGKVFQPHGLGHFMGLDVHDVGGYLEGHPSRPKGPGVGNLRTARTLKANMVLTIEPGCYFIDYLLDEALANPELNKFLVKEKIAEYRNFGGVRIEDDIIVTETGVELMSVVPRTVDEIEAWMRGEGGELDLTNKI